MRCRFIKKINKKKIKSREKIYKKYNNFFGGAGRQEIYLKKGIIIFVISKS
jgi:hypothetical protein